METNIKWRVISSQKQTARARRCADEWLPQTWTCFGGRACANNAILFLCVDKISDELTNMSGFRSELDVSHDTWGSLMNATFVLHRAWKMFFFFLFVGRFFKPKTTGWKLQDSGLHMLKDTLLDFTDSTEMPNLHNHGQ